MDNQPKYTAVAIFSDSQLALTRVHEPLKPMVMQYLARSIKVFISELGNIPICFYWTPGHEGIELNNKADQKAKQAAENKNGKSLTTTSLSKLLQITRELFHRRTANFETGRKPLRTQPRKMADALAKREKGEAAAIFHLRSGHAPLNEYLKRFNHHDTGKCDYCRVPETVAHFVLHFPQFKQQRRQLRAAIKEEKIKVNSYSLPDLLNTTKVYPMLAKFSPTTGGFRFLKSYLPKIEKDTSGSTS